MAASKLKSSINHVLFNFVLTLYKRPVKIQGKYDNGLRHESVKKHIQVLFWNFGISIAITQTTRNSLRSSASEVFLGKGALKICSKFTGAHPCRSVILLKSVSATLLKSHFGMGVLLYICYIFSEHFFIRTPLEGHFCYF